MTLQDLRRRRLLGLLVVSVLVAGLTVVAVLGRGVSSPAAVLLVLPMCWLGVVASRRELVTGVLVTVVCCFVPVVLTTTPAYAADLARAAAQAVVVAATAIAVWLLDQDARRVAARASRAASHDSLTGLLNRRGWLEGLDREHARAVRSGVRSTVVALDLDGLKRVNANQGQRRGDELIRATAERLRRTLRTEDLLARVGGDEFAVLLVGADVDQAIASTERLRASSPAGAGFSAGVATVREGEHPSATLARAEQALYRAKSTGGGISLPVQPWRPEVQDVAADDSEALEAPADDGAVDLTGAEHGRGMVGT